MLGSESTSPINECCDDHKNCDASYPLRCGHAGKSPHVGLEVFQEKSPHAVPDNIKRKDITIHQTVFQLPPQHHQQDETGEVQQELVEEKGVEMAEAFITRDTVGGVNVNCPRQVSGIAIKLLIKVIAPPAYRLRQNHPWGDDVHPAQSAQLLPFGINDEPDGSPDNGAEDAQSSTTQNQSRILAVEVPQVNHMIQPSTNNPQRNH